MDEEHPECVLDALIQYQRREIQAEGKANHFTDELVGALLLNLFSAGQSGKNSQCLIIFSTFLQRSATALLAT